MAPSKFQALDLLATLVAVVDPQGRVLFANAALEDALGMSRRSIAGAMLQACFTEPAQLESALQGASGNQFAALRYDAWLKRLNHDTLPVHVVVAQTDNPGEVIVELLPLEQQARQEREERLIDQAQ
ncbi:MAG: PAS domain-containing protein, partial [Burkholderiaceae bacterium]|nr:PAS domain-containing protein [Burkholderiaceae bacterium]